MQSIEHTLSDFLAHQYSDEQLVQLLAWTEDGGLTFDTCCCFVGLLTADHTLRREDEYEERTDRVPHYLMALEIPGADHAEDAFEFLADTDEGRRAKLLPRIHTEIEKRDRLRVVEELVLEAVLS